jgi:CRISPR/Cas system-associated exonuclease Cas4 (RecB family)
MIKISPTALQQFLSGCPGKLQFFQSHKLKEQYLPAPMRFGIEVHKYVEKGLPKNYGVGMNVLAVEVARKMIKVLDNQEYDIIAREIWHHARLTDDIEVVGKIDIVARDKDGTPVLVDLKSGARQWGKIKQETGEIRIPKSETFQAPIYLTPPIEDKYFDGEWPERLDYLVVPTDGATKIHSFYENAEARANLIEACHLFKYSSDMGFFPLNRGWMCKNCDWRRLCWSQPGWEKYYDER